METWDNTPKGYTTTGRFKIDLIVWKLGMLGQGFTTVILV